MPSRIVHQKPIASRPGTRSRATNRAITPTRIRYITVQKLNTGHPFRSATSIIAHANVVLE